MKKIIYSIILLLPIIMLFSSCIDSTTQTNQSASMAKIKAKGSTDTLSKWESQLQDAMTNAKGQYNNIPVQLVDYEKIGVISNNRDLKNLAKKFLSEDRYIPQFRLSNPEGLSIQKASNISNNKPYKYYKSLAYNRETLKAHLDSSMAIGQTILAIKWKYKDQTLTTKAVANNEKGIIYDSIGSNIIIIKTSKSASGQSSDFNDKQKNIQPVEAAALASFEAPPCKDIPQVAEQPSWHIVEKHSAVASPEIFIFNLLDKIGSAQAELVLDGYIVKKGGANTGMNDNYLTCASPHGSCYYEGGKCGAEIQVTHADYSENGTAEAAYGLYLTSGGNTVNVTFSAGWYSISISGSTSGETKKDTGKLHFYSSSWRLNY